jgi:murein DD-endopeptidase MepM/ murein hydrolase activator NlpD
MRTIPGPEFCQFTHSWLIRGPSAFGARSVLSHSAALVALCLLLGVQDQCALADDGAARTVAPDAKSVRVITKREGEVTHFSVENNEYCEVTMTFEMAVHHLDGSVSFPYTATFPARQVTLAFDLSPDAPGTKWDYSYTNYYKLGSNCARHDDTFIYELPYAPGDKFKVTQAYNGKFSHTGSNQYAVDWQMPEGTLVRASRGGVVVRVRDDSDRGGPSMDFDKYNNYVLIRHDDGTLGHYCHLKKGGCLVKIGQAVVTGQPIAHSGNTGFSSGPHLHFCVFKTKNGRERVSLPVKFMTASDHATTLLSGRSYRAAVPAIATSNKPALPTATAQGGSTQ